MSQSHYWRAERIDGDDECEHKHTHLTAAVRCARSQERQARLRGRRERWMIERHAKATK